MGSGGLVREKGKHFDCLKGGLRGVLTYCSYRVPLVKFEKVDSSILTGSYSF